MSFEDVVCVEEDGVDFFAFTAEAMLGCFEDRGTEVVLDFFQDRTRKGFAEVSDIGTSSYAESFA